MLRRPTLSVSVLLGTSSAAMFLIILTHLLPNVNVDFESSIVPTVSRRYETSAGDDISDLWVMNEGDAGDELSVGFRLKSCWGLTPVS